jgi:ATP synthase protein I
MDPLLRVQPINLLIKIQIVTLILIGFIFLLWQGVNFAIAGMFGAAVVVVNTWLQRKHLILAAQFSKADAGKNLQRAYRCVLERWAITLVLFAVGIIMLKLSALPMLLGFIVTQFAVFFEQIKRA